MARVTCTPCNVAWNRTYFICQLTAGFTISKSGLFPELTTRLSELFEKAGAAEFGGWLCVLPTLDLKLKTQNRSPPCEPNTTRHSEPRRHARPTRNFDQPFNPADSMQNLPSRSPQSCQRAPSHMYKLHSYRNPCAQHNTSFINSHSTNIQPHQKI